MTLHDPDVFRAKSLLDSALGYAARGWHVFPVYEIRDGACSCGRPDCHSPGKHPRTPRGVLNATRSEKQIRSWWQRWPLASIGIATGPSNLVVVDVDPRNGGDESLAELERTHGELGGTIRAITGGGGAHYYFARPIGVARVRGTPVAQGVDIKADGGYVLAPPSAHLSGRGYAWDAGAHPSETELAALPDWIAAQIQTQPAAKRDSGGAVTEGFLGAAFDSLGWLGRSLGADKAAARCPWEDEHSQGKRFDSSTVIFAPSKGYRVGWFYCSHEHCRHRTLADVLAILPESARRAARERLGLDTQYDPGQDRPPQIDTTQIHLDGEEWRKALRRNQDGRLTKDPGNAALLLANAPEWQGTLEYDSFADRVRWVRPVPELPGFEPPRPGEELGDHHAIYVGHRFAKIDGVAFAKTAIQDAIEAAARSNTRHPVREWFGSLVWDGVARIDDWLVRYLQADPTEYVGAVGRWWLLSIVARIYEPGCQVDHMLVLEGLQGCGKSSAVRILGGDYYLASLPDITTKDAAQVLQGHLLVEAGELDVFRGVAGTRVKDWVSRTVDSYRPSYGRCTVRRPRQCVFVGTTNESQYLTDATGARRYWPVAVRGLDRDALQADRDQLFAEAVARYQAGEQWHPDRSLTEQIASAQDERFASDAWEPRIAAWASLRNGFETGDVLAEVLGLEPGKWDRATQTRVGQCLRHLGYMPKRVREGSCLIRRYYREGTG